jgi:CRP-like cAMP-binding protein
MRSPPNATANQVTVASSSATANRAEAVPRDLVDDGRYGLDATFQGASGFERPDIRQTQLTRDGIPRSFRQELDGGWTLRFGPLPAIDVLGAGDFFGELGVVPHDAHWSRRRSASVVVTALTEAVAITGGDMRRLAEDIPKLGDALRIAAAARSQPENS